MIVMEEPWSIDPLGPRAPFEQIADRLRAGIRAGEWPPNTRIPSETEIVELTEVARTTARRAIKRLRAEGWIFTVPGRGSFTSPREQWPES